MSAPRRGWGVVAVVRCGEVDFSAAATPQASARNAAGVVVPGDVVDFISVIILANCIRGVDDALNADGGVQLRIVALHGTEVQGELCRGSCRGHEEIPSQLFAVVSK